MGWIKDETGRAVGLPREIGGIPLDEIGATGFGLAAAIDVAAPRDRIAAGRARGSSSRASARSASTPPAFLPRRARCWSAPATPAERSPTRTGSTSPRSIALKAAGRPLHDHPRGRKLDLDAVIDIPCDIWIPAARPDVIHAGNVARLQTRLVAEGANIPLLARGRAGARRARRAGAARFHRQCRRRHLCRGRISGREPRPPLSHSSTKKSAPTPQAVLDEVHRTGALPRAAALSLASGAGAAGDAAAAVG